MKFIYIFSRKNIFVYERKNKFMDINSITAKIFKDIKHNNLILLRENINILNLLSNQNKQNINIDINYIYNNKGYTPLHFACSCKNLEAVAILLENSADPNAGTIHDNRWTPLFTVTSRSNINISIVKLLIDYGGDIYFKFIVSNILDPTTPLSFCYMDGIGEIIEEYYFEKHNIKEVDE